MLENREFTDRRPRSFTPGDSPSWVMILIMVNVLVFVIRQLFSPGQMIPAGAVSVAALQKGEWWTVFTHAFVHADWTHLLTNMFFLHLAGRRVLADVGGRHFWYIYLVSGWVAAVTTLLLHPSSPMIGASGCVFGVMGAYAALHPDRSVTAWLGAWAPRLRAKHAFTGVFVVAVLLEMLILATPEYNIPLVSGVSHSAHAAGLLCGWLYARHLAPVLENLYHREEFFPQGLRRSNREKETPPPPAVPAAAITMRRVNQSLPNPVFKESPPPPLTNDEFLRQAVDPVLDKLYAGGMDSLTEAERKILDEAANRFSQKRGE